MCDFRNHNLIEIYRKNGSEFSEDIIVRWCVDCGGVVVDEEIDGRLYNHYMKMKFSKITYDYLKEHKGEKIK